MKNTGVIKHLDKLGRITIPKELKTKYKINFKDEIEIHCVKDKIFINKYEKSCDFCGSIYNLTKYKEGIICNKCLAEINKK